MLVATIDTGTTNTRVRIWRDGVPLGMAAQPVGVRDTSITGSRVKLTLAVRVALDEALRQAGAAQGDLGRILAAGMITSNVGLHEVPHVPAPAGVDDLACAMVSQAIEGVAGQPIWFVPGVRNRVEGLTAHNCEAMDMMRGEEVETFALLDALGIAGPALLVLPGSHSKFVRVDDAGRIAGCATTLAGELISVITQHTILAAALEHSHVETLDEAMAIEGAALAARVGLNRCCFAVRVLEQFTQASRDARASFLAGAVIGTDLQAARASSALGSCEGLPVLIGGTNEIARVFELLMQRDAYFGEGIRRVEPALMREASARGALRIARARGLL